MSELTTRLDDLHRRFEAALTAASDERALEDARIEFLGRSGEVTLLRRAIGSLPAPERPGAGKTINDAVAAMEGALDQAQARLQERAFEAELDERIDVTFPS